MKLAVVGSRTFSDFKYLKKILEFHTCTQIISGGARGADLLAQQYAAEKGIAYKEFLPDWEHEGKKAGMLRNIQIVDACDEVVAFWDGTSKGTANTIKLAEKAGKSVYKYWSEPDIMEGIGI